MRILCVFGRHAYGDAARGEGYEHAQFLPALRRLGHEVTLFDSFTREGRQSFAQLNRALLETFAGVAPEAVFVVLVQYEVWLETIGLMRGAGARVLNWSTDDSWRYPSFSRLVAPAFDLYVSTCAESLPRYAADGIDNVFLSQWAAASERLRAPRPARSCRYPVSFIGARYGYRPRMVERLRAAGVEVACFGHGWPGGAVDGARIPEIINDSAISLNFAGSSAGDAPAERQIKARSFEIPASGGLLLTDRAPGLERYYRPGEEAVVFEGEEDLLRQVRRTLDAPGERDRIAQAGYRRTAAEHTYEHRFAELLRRLPPTRAAGVPDFDAFAEVERAHAAPLGLRALRSALVAPCALAYGRRRGARAARRILFEVSWRTAGSTTYSARGWPGRLFFAES